MVRAEVEKIGCKAVAVVGDLADPKTCDAIIAETDNAFGRVDILVNAVRDDLGNVTRHCSIACLLSAPALRFC
jgi:NAD(P)-dependent dehydrogenase (short-subunit alcohol dehydrogenase family)